MAYDWYRNVKLFLSMGTRVRDTIRMVFNKFIAEAGTRYVVLVELPLPDYNPLYIEYQDGAIHSAHSNAGEYSIFDAERKLHFALRYAVNFNVETKEIKGKVRPVLYIYFERPSI